jgi:class 3 adenylate cyclase
VTEASSPNSTPPLEVAHVLFMDIVAYSKLPMDQQQQVLRDLQEAVRSTPTFIRAAAEDQLIRLPTGDGMALVFFRDPEAPVHCALQLAKALRECPNMRLRMGIHAGPVYHVADINANRNVAGGGINIAQRVMDCGDAGHILVSAAQAEVLSQVSSWCEMLHDIGEVEVKHGLRIRLYSFYADGVGRTELPEKVSAQRAVLASSMSSAKKKRRSLILAAGSIVLAISAIGGWLFHTKKAHALGATDTIVLADFTNKTGDAIFDDTLRQGLAVQLQQSPFLSLISEDRIKETLRLMRQPLDAPLTPVVARQVCQRTGSAALLGGSIAKLGSQYVLGLRAVNCRSGDSLGEDQVTADGKEQVLKALADATTRLRTKLGESLSTVEKFDTPLEQATTPSLQALQAYTLGRRQLIWNGDSAAAVPLFEQAIQGDPNFAMAHLSLGLSYMSLGKSNLAVEKFRRAYELRESVSQWEKFAIESRYYYGAMGDLEKSRQIYELWSESYPREFIPFAVLSDIYGRLGHYDGAFSASSHSLSLSSMNPGSRAVIVAAYLNLNLLKEARAAAEEAQKKDLDSVDLHLMLYRLAFLENDTAGMTQQAAWAAGKTGVEDAMLASEATTAAYFGLASRAREFTRRAVTLVERADENETAANYEATAAMTEAFFGNLAETRKCVAATMAHSPSRDARVGAAIALAFIGDTARARAMADDLARRFPSDTLVRFNFTPALNAQLAIANDDFSAAIRELEAAAPYELGQAGSDLALALYPVYVRGEAYLAARHGVEAAREFQKISDHRGVVFNEVIGALARLQIGRAYAMQGDTLKARDAYQDFLTLWKDADPDVPILKQAKAEYAKLQ